MKWLLIEDFGPWSACAAFTSSLPACFDFGHSSPRRRLISAQIAGTILCKSPIAANPAFVTMFAVRGNMKVVREDIGRHNAMDKVVGRCVLDNSVPLTEYGLLVSGRVSFEIIQKAAIAGIAFIAAVGAPSSLAVETADRFGITLAGFVRDGKANVYTHPYRVAM